MALPLSKIRTKVAEQTIKRNTHPTKAPGYELITGKILKELPKKGLQAITQIFNAIFRLEYFPRHWKIGQVIMIPKPGKNPTEATSYRPISLLPLLSKILEKIILKRLTPILTTNNVIPAHQFGFRQKHGTVQQTHRIIHKIYEDLENKSYCTAAFIDISQAFDRVWQMGLLLIPYTGRSTTGQHTRPNTLHDFHSGPTRGRTDGHCNICRRHRSPSIT
jgi:hypothetical protein